MAPVPEEHKGTTEIPYNGLPQQEANVNMDRIVVSGMSGMFPDSNNIKELSNILYNKINPVTTESRWKYSYPEIPNHTGKIPNIDKFDAQFFKVNNLLADHMDPMSRKLLEQSYQAIYDAGVNPRSLWGKKVGVYTGTCIFGETAQANLYGDQSNTPWSVLGCSKSMLANRVSYWLNLKGPSMVIDGSCASSMLALQRAYESINSGECEAAIVGTSSIALHPESLVHSGRITPLCMDGKTKAFDKNADGFTQSGAVVVLFLQKAKNAKRVYADVCSIRSQFSPMTNKFGQVYGHYRDQEKTTTFLKGFYESAAINPTNVEYVEAFGSASPEADKCELETMSNVMCKDRKSPLFVGCISSNIGYTEAATGLCGVIKVLLGFHTGRLAANLHCDNPRDDVKALREGQMRIVTEHQHFGCSYVAVNNMSVTGLNAHLLLQGQRKSKDLSRYRTNIPHLVAVSGRQEPAVHQILDELKSSSIDTEQIGLLHDIHEENISGHLARGYVILGENEKNETRGLMQGVDYYDDITRPLWFVYSGMGSQWMGMGTQLMRIPIFAASMERCRLALKPKGLDVIEIITSSNKTIFDNILHSFVGITAVQIGLTDVLRELGLEPDNVIGHSVGELGCAYADRCLTAEETILSAYSRGLVSLQTPFIHGSMAAVGLGYKQIVSMCPPEIEVACHNSAESSTISGPSDVMREFVMKLTAQGIFAREVPCSNIAYHSRYIKEAGPALLKYLKEVLKAPKVRSERWLSTSVPQNRWNEPAAKLSSPEYYTNNLLNPVLFEETSKLIPSNAVLVEVAPHGLLQAILKRSLPDSCINIPLTRRGHSDNALFMLQAIGKLYVQGYQPRIKELYPKIEYPVSSGTPWLSHLVEWAHDEDWNVPANPIPEETSAAAAKFIISLHDDEHTYLMGNTHRNETLYPFSGALVCVWDTLAMSVGAKRRDLSVQFHDVHLYEQPRLHNDKLLRLYVQLQKGNGYFEVKNSVTKIASGYVFGEGKHSSSKSEKILVDAEEMSLTSEDVYKLFYSRGSCYTGEFKSIKSLNGDMTRAEISWTGNWVTLLDSMLQLNALRRDYDGMTQPRFIGRLNVDVTKHLRSYNSKLDNNTFTYNMLQEQTHTSCGGVVMKNIKFNDLPPLSLRPLVLKALNTSTLQSDSQNKFGENWYLKSSELQYTGVKNNITLRSSTIGDLNTLHWEEVPELAPNKIKITVHFAGLNTRDAKRASGAAPFKVDDELDLGYGMDYSGVTDSGDRVMGIISGGAASSRVAAEPLMLWPVPTHWTLEDAATVPLPYAHAFYCLAIKAELLRGQSLLVHGATGALGLAVISIALAHDCKVFATVSNLKKKQYLRKVFPSLPDDHIGNSRNDAFADMVLHVTKGKGCDFVINCLQGGLKNKSMKCLSVQGTSLDTHQISCRENYQFGMYELTDEKNYVTVDFSSIFKMNNEKEMRELQLMMCKGIKCGYVRPLPRVTYQEPSDAQRAFHLLAASRHRGRALLCLHGKKLSVTPRLMISPKSSHLLICATSNDILICKMIYILLERGAKNIVLQRESKMRNGYLSLQTKKWEKLGANIRLTDVNLHDTKNIQILIKDCNNLGPVEGIYVLTSCLADNLKNKKQITSLIQNLDVITRKYCPSIKAFAVFNEESNIGKEVCISRSDDKLPSTMLNLPIINKFGYEDNGLTYEAALEVMEQAMRADCPVIQAQTLPQTFECKLLDRIATIADINIQAPTSNNDSLEKLGINLDKSKAISILKEDFGIELSAEEIQNLTIERIKEIERGVTGNMDTVTGLHALFNHVDHDVLLATHDMVFMPTALQCVAESGEMLKNKETHLILVPGFEGHHNKFYTLCERLKLPAVVLQPGLDHPHETVAEMASRLAKVVLKKLEPKNKFYLLGYSFGVQVALEMAAILEDQGLEGVVFCVDASPDTFPTALDSWLSEAGATDETQLQDAIVQHMYTLMAGGTSEYLQLELQKAQNWPQKIEVGVRALLGHITLSSQYVRAFIEMAYARIEQARRYDAQRLREHPLRSLLVVLRSSCQPASVEPDLGLSRYSVRGPQVYNLSADHARVLEDLRCASIVNTHLDDDILHSFQNRNICEKYYYV